MKRLLLVLTLLIIPFSLFASNNDITKSKGTDQDVIVQLTPSPEQTDVSRYTKIEAVFNIVLDSKHVKKHDVKLKCLSCEKKKEKVKGTVSYVEGDKKVQFVPDAPLIPGMYEVEFKSLKAHKDHKNTKIKEIKYRFIVIEELLQSIVITPSTIEIKEGEPLQLQAFGHYDNGTEKNITMQVQWLVADTQIVTVDANATLIAVKDGTTTLMAEMENVETTASIIVYKVIDGHRLPQDPGEAGKQTLVGIDINNNGVRDDVERGIYLHYKRPIDQAFVMQDMKALQEIFVDENRIQNAVQLEKIQQKATDCYMYLFAIKKHKPSSNSYAKNVQINTKERLKAYLDYDNALSGGVYGSGPKDWIESACDFNVTKVLVQQP